VPAKASFAGFVSYAHEDARSVDAFMRLMRPRCGMQREVRLDGWWDRAILCGHGWRGEIDRALRECDFGLLLVSPSLLASSFIADNEIPALIASERPIFPVGLVRVDLARADLKGLDEYQLQLLRRTGEVGGRWFTELGGANRDRFCDELVAAMVDRLLGRGGGREWPSV
jgi:hypothetical protein